MYDELLRVQLPQGCRTIRIEANWMRGASLELAAIKQMRRSALRTISGFRTVSDEVATVLAGMLPVDILAKEMEKIYMARIATGDAVSMDVIRSERATSMATWQERWNTANSGR
ncbi:uncharacterized protein [Drosophila virilis]|uniref:uncharacterized protein n=1 Tax=Drosophila virilis TaxID=7244 RepID=UPI0038B2F043